MYSSADQSPAATLAWIIGTGLAAAVLVEAVRQRMVDMNPRLEPVVLGLGLFGVNLFFFNFFMPVVFTVDIPDLLIRTGVDAAAVALGSGVASAVRPRLTARRRNG